MDFRKTLILVMIALTTGVLTCAQSVSVTLPATPDSIITGNAVKNKPQIDTVISNTSTITGTVSHNGDRIPNAVIHRIDSTETVRREAAAVKDPIALPDSTAQRPGDELITRREFEAALSALGKKGPNREKGKTPLDSYLRRTYVALRSNLFCPLTNIGVEVPIGNRWSVAADYYCPWISRRQMNRWTAEHNTASLQVLAGLLEGRYWFGTNHTKKADPKYRLTGHSIAVVGGWGYYDLELNRKGLQGEAWLGGVDYTYALPAFKGAVNFEFGITLGVIATHYRPYDSREEAGYLIHERGTYGDKLYFGPVKAQVAVVVPIREKPVYWKSVKPSKKK